MPWLEDLGSVLVEENVGVINTNIFFTSKAGIPAGDGPYISIVQTSGTGYELTHNSLVPSAVFPGAQIIVRAKQPPLAESTARTAFRAFFQVRNRMIGGVWYRRLRPVQMPFDIGLDDTGQRIMYSFNILGERAFE